MVLVDTAVRTYPLSFTRLFLFVALSYGSLRHYVIYSFANFSLFWIDVGNGGYEPLYAAQGAPGAAAPNYGATARPL